jgi:hypothetical protein
MNLVTAYGQNLPKCKKSESYTWGYVIKHSAMKAYGGVDV